MKRTLNVTAAAAGVMLLISVVVWFAIPYCIEEYSTAADIGPRAFPQMVCAAMAVLSILQMVLLAAGIQKGRHVEVCLSGLASVFAAMALAVLAVVCARYINLLVTAVICAEIFLILLKVKDWRYYLVVAVTGIILFGLMKYIMNIQL